MVISEWEEGISGLFSWVKRHPNDPEGHSPAWASPAVGAGMGSDTGPQSAPLSVQSEVSQAYYSGLCEPVQISLLSPDM